MEEGMCDGGALYRQESQLPVVMVVVTSIVGCKDGLIIVEK
jgi:hypothetical protein